MRSVAFHSVCNNLFGVCIPFAPSSVLRNKIKNFGSVSDVLVQAYSNLNLNGSTDVLTLM